VTSEPQAREPQRIRLTLSPQAERYARRDAPREARLRAARGALPLPPVELATVLFALMHDPDAEVKGVARESLEGLPDSVCQAVLSGEVHPAILSHLARAFRDREDRAERVALNPAADDATLAFLASLPFKRVVDIVSNNQERMLRAPEIVDALGSNPLTGRAVIERILAFVGSEPAAGSEAGERAVSDAEAEAALRAVLGPELGRFARSLVEDSGKPTGQALTGEISNVYALIQKMSVYQKIKLARLGNREARGLLVRDRNKVVAVAAILSPKITDNEIVAVARSRNVSDEVLRIIASHRQWTRNYKVKLALASNPKTPQPVAMGFVALLHESDMLSLMKSKDVPAAVATHARRMLTKKGKL
jgi:hypothetical protein